MKGRLEEKESLIYAGKGCDLNLIVLRSNRKAILIELIPELIPSS
jgi:hypothetical protein